MPLLWYVRDMAGLGGTKFGCGMGFCGACTVHPNATQCAHILLPMSAVAGQEIITIEAIAGPNALHLVQTAWIETLAATPKPSDEEIENAVAGNVCRCGTYAY